MPTIGETCVAITQQQESWEVEKVQRYARRNKIHYIDRLLNELEQLNIAEESEVPPGLRTLCKDFIDGEAHPLSQRRPEDVPIAEWMDALYDVQDGLMFTAEDDEE
ncbi:MAG TPA: hypothetical protein VMW49_01585 [Candidatus Dormibacteraeota bacterium]|nr:hypothetical protein [Candidatus Dormibacteraeota bacterium]